MHFLPVVHYAFIEIGRVRFEILDNVVCRRFTLQVRLHTFESQLIFDVVRIGVGQREIELKLLALLQYSQNLEIV